MKKIFSFILMATVMLMATACNNFESDEGEVEKNEIPNIGTVTELFDGNRKVWFFCPDESTPCYDSEVELVLVTEDKSVVELYYNFGYSSRKEDYAEVTGGDKETNPFSSIRFTLSDFDGLTDDEVLKMVKSHYKDASSGVVVRLKDDVINRNRTIGLVKLPYEIRYSGIRDDSGNNLVAEYIKLFDATPFQNSGFRRIGDYIIEVDDINNDIISSAKVKNEEYFGIRTSRSMGSGVLVTKTNFGDISDLDFDNVEGLTYENWEDIYEF